MGRYATHLARALALLGIVFVALGQENPSLSGSGFDLSVRIDNDALQDQDDHYSSGASLHLVSKKTPEPDSLRAGIGRVLGLRWPGSHQVLAIGLQQALFTPQDIKRAMPAEDDAPYAGLLYASLSVSGLDSQHLQAWSLHAGVIGPAAGGEWLQRTGHRITGASEPQGWDHQVGNEALLALAHERRWRSLVWGQADAWGGDLLTGVSLAVGNLITAGRLAGGLRLGWSVPDDFRMPSLFLGDTSIGHTVATPATDRRSAYAFAMLDVHLVGYVAPGDGRITTGGPAVDYDPYMVSGHLGFHLAAGRWDLTVSGILATIPHQTPNDRRFEGYGRADLGFRF